MTLKSFILSVLILATNIGCATTAPTPMSSGDVINCIHKYDDNIVITYDRENISRFIINDVIMFQIIDVNGDTVFLNIYEIENYVCT